MSNLRLQMKIFLIGMLLLSFVSSGLLTGYYGINSEISFIRGSEEDFQLIWQNHTTQTFSNDWNSEIMGENWEVGEDMILIDDQLYVTSTLFGVDSVDIGFFSHNITSDTTLSNQQSTAIWSRPEFTYVSDLEYSTNGNLILAGTMRRFIQQENDSHTSEVYDLMVLTYDLEEQRWSNEWIWPTIDSEYNNDAIISSDNDLYLIGSKHHFSHGNSIIVAKINLHSYETEWIKTYEELGTEEGFSLALGTDNFLYALGSQSSISREEKYYLLKIQPESGELVWSMSWGSQRINRGKSLIYGSDDHLYLTGYSYDLSDLNSNVSIFKIDPKNQEIVWSQTWGTKLRDGGQDIVEYKDNLVVVGTANAPTVSGGELLLLEVNSTNGEILTSSLWGSTNSEQGRKVIIDQEEEGFYVLANVITTNDLKSDSNVIIGYFRTELSYSKENSNYQNLLFGTLILLSLLTVILWLNRPILKRDFFHRKTKKGEL